MDEQVNERLIHSGDAMQTGCKKLLPCNTETDYDRARSTIIFQSVRANGLRLNYSGGKGLNLQLKEAVRELAPST